MGFDKENVQGKGEILLMKDCLFCKIAAGDIPAQKVYEDEDFLAFRDIAPAAPFHALFITKKHMANLGEMAAQDVELIGKLMALIGREAAGLGLEEGYRVVSNCGEQGGQTVAHLHFHVLGGRNMQWPPG